VYCIDCQILVDSAAPRCPKCLRRSTLVQDAAVAVAPSKRTSGGEIALLLVLAFALRAGAYVRKPLLDWMTVGDACVTLVIAVALIWFVSRVRKEGVETIKATATIPLVIGGTVIGALALAMGTGAIWLASSPLEMSHGRRTPALHGWTWALLSGVFALMIGWLSSLLWRKLLLSKSPNRS
jgi:hypothetical protein